MDLQRAFYTKFLRKHHSGAYATQKNAIQTKFACLKGRTSTRYILFTRLLHVDVIRNVRIPERQGTCLSRHAMPAISFTGCTSPASIGLNATFPATPNTLTRCGASSHALTSHNSHTKGVVFACVTLPHHTGMHEYTHIFASARLSFELFFPRFVCVSRSLNIRV